MHHSRGDEWELCNVVPCHFGGPSSGVSVYEMETCCYGVQKHVSVHTALEEFMLWEISPQSHYKVVDDLIGIGISPSLCQLRAMMHCA